MQAKSLRFLDVSDTTWDKKGIDYMVQALTCTPVTPTSTASAPGSSLGQPNGHFGNPSSEKVESESPTEMEMKREESRASTSFVRPAPLLREVEGPEAPSALQTLRMDGCALRPNSLEALGRSEAKMQMCGKELTRVSHGCSVVRYQKHLFTAQQDRSTRRCSSSDHDPRLSRRLVVNVVLLPGPHIFKLRHIAITFFTIS
jgi:hypothetical protein